MNDNDTGIKGRLRHQQQRVLVVVGAATIAVLAINLALVVWAMEQDRTVAPVLQQVSSAVPVSQVPVPGPLAFVTEGGLPSLLPMAEGADSVQCQYVDVVFETPVETQDLQRYADLGLTLNSRIDGQTWSACIDPDSRESVSSLPEVASVDAIRAQDRLSESLKNDRRIYDHDRRPNGGIAYSVLFQPGTSPAQAREMADSMGYQLEEFDEAAFPSLLATNIVVPEGDLGVLAEVGIIARIEPVLPPATPTNKERGQPLSRVDVVQGAPYGLNGSGVTVGIWEPGSVPFGDHQDLAGRVTVGPGQTTRPANHATHVAGTIGSSGSVIPGTEGMAPKVKMTGYDVRSSDNAPEMLAASRSVNSSGQPEYIHLSSHSYGFRNGWQCCYNNDYIYYDTSAWGAYTNHAVAMDNMVHLTGHIASFAVGNDRRPIFENPDPNTTYPGGHPNMSGPMVNNCTQHQYDQYQHADGVLADCIGGESGSKNILSIGAMRNAGSVASFSSYGPMDDGRIKPDLVAQGNPLLSTVWNGGSSTTASAEYSGTSMSTPLVSGVVALVMQEAMTNPSDPFRRVAKKMTHQEMKALLTHTARDVSGFDQTNPGPDYATGWGIVDAEAAVILLRNGGLMQGSVHATGAAGAWTYPVSVDTGQSELKITIAWTDPPGNPRAAKALVNDLDLRLISPDGTEYTPWKLGGMEDPSAPAVRNGGNDDVNNVEQVSILSPADGQWQVKVKSDPGNMPFGPQSFAVAGIVSADTIVSPIQGWVGPEPQGSP